MTHLQSLLSSLPSILAAVLAFAFLIVVHEAGHALAARLVGMRIVRFSVGYGKVLWSFRLGETELALSAIPVGGYVWIAGMIPDDGVDPEAPHAWNNQPALRRIAAIAAGPVASYAGAVLVAAALFVTVGLRVPVDGPYVGELAPGAPAEQAGLQPGDRILSIGGEPTETWDAMLAAIQRNPGRTVTVVVSRGEGAGAQRLERSLTPRDEGGVGRAGFSQHSRLERRAPGAATAEAFRYTNVAMKAQASGLWRALSRKEKAGLSGPLDIGRTLAHGARAGAERFFTLIWILSVALSVLNLLPLPPLDGGKLAFLLWELVTGKRASRKLEEAISMAGFALLAALLVGVTIFGDLPKLLR